MSVCLITPRLPPAIDGLGNYCRQLWQHCCAPSASAAKANFCQTPWTFLVLDGAERSARIWPEVKIEQLSGSGDNLTSRLMAINPDTVILQYVGYGFDHSGSPFWLASALADWRLQRPAARLLVMFHETWSSGKPWQRVFWQMRAQKKCVKQVLDVASLAVTSTKANADSLEVLGSKTAIRIIPIGSSFNIQASKQKNWHHLLIFGKEPSRRSAIKTHRLLIESLVAARLVEGIVLAGQSAHESSLESELLKNSPGRDIEIITCFNYPNDLIPDPVRNCGLALMHTQSTHLLKSTAFQLAVQLEQVAITLEERDADPPLMAGKHYLSYQQKSIESLLTDLHNPQLLLEISANCAHLSAGLLSWPQIAHQWAQLVDENTSP
jgi:hypothetical protein